jgi:hypothetical protein
MWTQCNFQDGGRTQCPRVTAREFAVGQAAAAIIGLLLRRRPSRAAENKWNRLLPTFDFWIIGNAVHKMLCLMMTKSMHKMRVAWEKAGYDRHTVCHNTYRPGMFD